MIINLKIDYFQEMFLATLLEAAKRIVSETTTILKFEALAGQISMN